MTLMVFEEEIVGGLHPHVCQNVIKAQLDQHAVLFELSPAGDSHRDRLLLNRDSADYVANFLQHTPRIKGLSIVSNINQEDGAMEVMANALRSTKQIVILCLWGDGDDYDDTYGYDDGPNMDNGTMLECLSFALPDNTSVRSLRFHFYNFSTDHCNRTHLHRLLLQKRDFQKLTLSACDFGPDISFLLEGLAVQTDLQELSIDMDDFEKKLDDADLAAILDVVRKKGPRNTLRVLNLYDCGLGTKSLSSLHKLLGQKDCKLHGLSLGGTRRLFRIHTRLRREFLQTLCFSNHSLQRIHAGHKSQMSFQRILELCMQRNQLLAQVRASVRHSSSRDLSIWSHALAYLAKEDGFIGKTCMFAALTTLAPQLDHSASSLPVKRGRHDA